MSISSIFGNVENICWIIKGVLEFLIITELTSASVLFAKWSPVITTSCYSLKTSIFGLQVYSRKKLIENVQARVMGSKTWTWAGPRATAAKTVTVFLENKIYFVWTIGRVAIDFRLKNRKLAFQKQEKAGDHKISETMRKFKMNQKVEGGSETLRCWEN